MMSNAVMSTLPVKFNHTNSYFIASNVRHHFFEWDVEIVSNLRMSSYAVRTELVLLSKCRCYSEARTTLNKYPKQQIIILCITFLSLRLEGRYNPESSYAT
jgi:hypothetical protein